MASIARTAVTATLVAFALCLALPTQAQEVVSILNQKEWSVAGVGISADEYGTCAATDASHADASLWLQVTETPSQNVINEVSVMHPGDPQATAAALQIGSDRFVLAVTDGDRLSAAAGDGGKIVAAMLKNAGLTLQFEGVSAPKPYSYDLAEFPAAYAALVQHCRAPANP
ncbi:MAG TPA: hypothetical protein VE914_18785 [Candidatus Angelobacter sp.]|nr:hypothetical protein [Candidatus Angelobacter sp.]